MAIQSNSTMNSIRLVLTIFGAIAIAFGIAAEGAELSITKKEITTTAAKVSLPRIRLKTTRRITSLLKTRGNAESNELVQNAVKELDKGNFWGALGQLSKAVEQDPKNAQPYYVRGLLWDDAQFSVRAFADFKKACELSPNSPDYPLSVADLAKRELDFQTAESYLKRAQSAYRSSNNSQSANNLEAAIEDAKSSAQWYLQNYGLDKISLEGNQ